MRLTLIRHAATAWSGLRYCGRTDVPIDAAGREQLHQLVDHLTGDGASGRADDLVRVAPPCTTTVITSPALRARETATAISAALGGDLRLDERLREIDFGEAEGLTFLEIEHRWPQLAAELLHDHAEVDWPRGERWSDFAARVGGAWRDLSTGPCDAIVVTHGGPLRLILRLALRRWPLSVPTDLGPAHVVRLAERQGWKVYGSWAPIRTGVEPRERI